VIDASTQKIFSKTTLYSYWFKKNWYYHRSVAEFYSWAIPKSAMVLQIGAKNGSLLAATNPLIGIGVEYESACLAIARHSYPAYTFYATLDEVAPQTFEYIILSSTLMESIDVHKLFFDLKKFCTDSTRIVLDNYSCWWEPVLRLAQKVGLRKPSTFDNWLTKNDIQNFLYLNGFEEIYSGRRMLIPFYIPGISLFINSVVAHIPFVNRLCLIEWTIARMVHQKEKVSSVSVIVPCRNERGNVEEIVKTLPSLGSKTEIIFIEGHSKDGTLDEIQRVAATYPEKNISYFVQDGKGKGDAVRLGFAKAKHDILIIFDGDNTIPMHELPRFVQVLDTGKGEFINGSRFVYAMEKGATRFLNIIANHCFGIGFSWLLGQKVKDTLCGTKVLYKKDYEKIAHNRAYFGEFDPFGDFDLLFGAAKLHLKIIDVAVHYKSRTYGSTQIRRFYHGIILAKMWIFALRKFKF